MGHSITLNEEFGVIAVRFYGRPAFLEIASVFNELVLIPGFEPGLKLIADFRTCGTAITGNEVRQLAERLKSTDAAWGATKWMILASKDETFGLSRMLMSLTYKLQATTNVFRDAEAADDWFGLGLEVQEILDLTPELVGHSSG